MSRIKIGLKKVIVCGLLGMTAVAGIVVNGVPGPETYSLADIVTWLMLPRTIAAIVSVPLLTAGPYLGVSIALNWNASAQQEESAPTPTPSLSDRPELTAPAVFMPLDRSLLVYGAEAERELEIVKRAEAQGLSLDELKDLRICLLRRKLADDFNDSWIDGPIRPLQALSSANNDLIESKYVIDHQGRIGRESIENVGLIGFGSDDPVRLLRGIKSVSVNCGALFPAAAATFLAMKERLAAQDIRLDLDLQDINSHNQIIKAKRMPGNIDFLFAADAAFFIVGQLKFYRILVVHGEDQWAFVRKGRSSARNSRLFVFQDSTAHLQFKTGIGLPKSTIRKWIEEGEQVPVYRTDRMDKGDAIIVWSPLSYLFEKSRNFRTIDKPFRNWISLFGNEEWLSGSRQIEKEIFVKLFVEEWHKGREDKPASLKRLLDIPGYIERFSVSAGLDFETGFGRWAN